MPACSRGQEPRRCGRSRSRSRRRSAAAPCSVAISRQAGDTRPRVEAHAAGALHHRFEDHRGHAPGVPLDQLAELAAPPDPGRRRGRRAAAANTCAAPAGRRKRVHPVRPDRRRHARERVAVVTAADGEHPVRAGRGWACSAILIATSTATEPESARKTCSRRSRRGGGASSASRRPSSIAGSWVSPPNITWHIRSELRREPRRPAPGTAYPWIAHHHDDIPSMTSRPSASRSRSRTPRRFDQHAGAPAWHRRVGMPHRARGRRPAGPRQRPPLRRESLLSVRARSTGRSSRPGRDLDHHPPPAARRSSAAAPVPEPPAQPSCVRPWPGRVRPQCARSDARSTPNSQCRVTGP